MIAVYVQVVLASMKQIVIRTVPAHVLEKKVLGQVLMIAERVQVVTLVLR